MSKKKYYKSRVSSYKRSELYKKIIISLIIILILLVGYLIIHFLKFDHNKVKVETKIKYQELIAENVVFLGDSITNRYDLDKYFPDTNVVNSGVEANRTSHILDDMYNRIYKYNPSKVFILIGTNQVPGDSVKKIVSDIEKIVMEIHKNRKLAKVYVESIYPVDPNREGSLASDKNNNTIKEINEKLSKSASLLNFTYIDIYSKLIDGDNLKDEYSIDGLHLSEKGYEVVTKTIEKYVKG